MKCGNCGSGKIQIETKNDKWSTNCPTCGEIIQDGVKIKSGKQFGGSIWGSHPPEKSRV